MAAVSLGPERRSLAAAPDGSVVEKTPTTRGAIKRDKTPRPHVCVVVLGTGRSGTSVTARILTELGIRLNYNPAEMSDQNPDGAFEDEFIFKTHSDFFNAGGFGRVRPLPVGWIDSDAATAAMAELEAYVRQEFGSEFLWGFKVPRTSVLLPLWKHIFNRVKVVPRYVVCVRSPAAFVQSMANNYRISQNDAELVWLSRTVAALRDTGLDCFILHYERLLADAPRTIGMLAQYALGSAPDPARIEAIVADCINPRLDRARINNIVIANPIIPSLAAALDNCEGSDFQRSELIETVLNCDRILAAFSPHLGNRQRETPARGPRVPSAASALQPQQAIKNDRVSAPMRPEDIRMNHPAADPRDPAGPPETGSREIAPRDEEFTRLTAKWQRQMGESTKRHIQRAELLREQLAEQRAQWQQQAVAVAAAHAEESERWRQQAVAVAAAHAEESERLSKQIGEKEIELAGLIASQPEEFARFHEQIAQRDTQLTEMTHHLEQLVEQYRLQTIELKWATTERENLSLKVASLVALQASNRRSPSPASGTPRGDGATGELRAAAKREPAPAQQRDAAVVPNGRSLPAQPENGAATSARNPEPKRHETSARWRARALLLRPRTYFLSWFQTR